MKHGLQQEVEALVRGIAASILVGGRAHTREGDGGVGEVQLYHPSSPEIAWKRLRTPHGRCSRRVVLLAALDAAAILACSSCYGRNEENKERKKLTSI